MGCGRIRLTVNSKLEESEGFEPSVPLPALRISSATLSTTQPTLLAEEAASKGGIRVWQALFEKNVIKITCSEWAEAKRRHPSCWLERRWLW